MTQSNLPTPISSKPDPLIRIAILEKQVIQLEERLAKLESPIKAPIPEQPHSESKLFEIVKVDTKITEVNDVFSTFAWIFKLKNLANMPLDFSVTIEFLDKDGFIVNTGFESNVLLQDENVQSFTGVVLIKAEVVGNVASVNAKVKVH